MSWRWTAGQDEAGKLSSTNEASCGDARRQQQESKSFSDRKDPIFFSGTLSATDMDEYFSEADMSVEYNRNFIPVSGPLPTPQPTKCDKFRMFVGTWNVGGKAPHDGLNLQDWLCTPAVSDIYVLGFQEVVPLNAGNVLVAEDKAPAAKWLSLIRQALNEKPGKTPVGGPDETLPMHPDQFRRPRVSFCDLITIQDMVEADEEDGEDWVYDSDVDVEGESTNTIPSDDDTAATGCPNHRRSRGSRRRGGGYCLVASKQMVGVFLCVWIRSDLVRDVVRVKASCVTRGIMGYMGNKGSIAISLCLRRSTFCFICTHLASGENKKNEERRNSDVDEILKRTRFPRSRRRQIDPLLTPKTILQHEKIVWLGDLNYRLSMGCSETEQHLLRNNWSALLEKDQLRMEQKAGKIFSGWQEGKIYFPPTYKYLTNSDLYVVHQTEQSKEKRRIPAWCDRILFRGEGIKQVCYVRGESRFSDHRPVYSIFTVRITKAAEEGNTTDVTATNTSTPRSTTPTTNTTSTNIRDAALRKLTATTPTGDSSSKKKGGYKVKWPAWAGLSATTTTMASTSSIRCNSSISDNSSPKVEGEEMQHGQISRTQSCRLSSRS